MSIRKKSPTVRLLEKALGESLTLGLRLSSIRKGEDLTLEIFAEKLGISKQHLSDIEKGRKSVSPERAARFAKALGYAEDKFIQLALQDLLIQANLNYKVIIQ
jgi:transcriptional regulator with XRE-family HTH domain